MFGVTNDIHCKFTYKSGACANSGYQALFFPLREKGLGTRLLKTQQWSIEHFSILLPDKLFMHNNIIGYSRVMEKNYFRYAGVREHNTVTIEYNTRKIKCGVPILLEVQAVDAVIKESMQVQPINLIFRSRQWSNAIVVKMQLTKTPLTVFK